MTPVLRTKPVWFRVQQGAFTAAIGGLLVLWTGVLAPGSVRPALLLASVGVAAAAVVRVVRTELVVSSDGLVYRDLFRTRSVPWSAIRRLGLRRAHPFPPAQISPFTALEVDEGPRRHVVYGTSLLTSARRAELYRLLAREARSRGIPLDFAESELTTAIATRS